MRVSTVDRPPVPQGPRAYRSRLRALGPPAALLPAAVLGLLALLVLHGSTSLLRGGTAFAMAVLAAPALLAWGVPLSHGPTAYLAAIAASAAVWLLLGTIAARRATRAPAASWRDFWRELAWLAGGLWLGVVVALVAADLLLAGALF